MKTWLYLDDERRFGRKDGIAFATCHDEPSGDKNDAVFYKNK